MPSPSQSPENGNVTLVAKREAVIGGTEATTVFAQLVDDEELIGRGAEDRDRVNAIAVPVAGERHITFVAEEEPEVADALGVRVSQVDAAITLAVDAGGGHGVSIPVAEQRDVARVSEVELLG